MRRNRSIREHKNKLLHQRILSLAEKRKIAKDRLLNKNNRVVVSNPVTNKVIDRRILNASKFSRRSNRTQPYPDTAPTPSNSDSNFPGFMPFDQYQYKSDKVKVCHIIESLGLGGAQTMMFEIVNGLNKYYNQHIDNFVIILSKETKPYKPTEMCESYGVHPDRVSPHDLNDFFTSNDITIAVHHRIAVSKSLKHYLPTRVKYILINHTWNNISAIQSFPSCDYYVSVCQFLHKRTFWPSFVHQSRRLVILNGVENDYLSDIEPYNLGDGFKTGRCHRMVSGKFHADSLSWMNRRILPKIPSFQHIVIGSSEEVKSYCKKYKWLQYFGLIANRQRKMSIIKSLDAYFYETFSDEGASVAILEALSLGIPVLTKPLGGCGELVVEGLNGFICRDRQIYQLRLEQLFYNKDFQEDIKRKCLEDFNNRLHVKHTTCKYIQLFEHIKSREISA
jgi:glycosyltransferase involved in cell wall biosynthesis